MSTTRPTPSWRGRHARDPEVLQAYQQAYGTPPENAFAALGYDTIGLIADAIRRAGAAEPAKIRDALAATQGYQGITGTISYPKDTRVPQKTVTLIGVKDDKLMLGAEVMPSLDSQLPEPSRDPARVPRPGRQPRDAGAPCPWPKIPSPG